MIELLEARRLFDAVALGETYFSDAPLNSGSVRTMGSIGGVTYFGRRGDTQAGVGGRAELWRTDGTAAGTYKIPVTTRALYSYPPNEAPPPISNFTDVNGTFYFTISLSGDGYELWKSDGTTAGTQYLSSLGYSGSATTANPKDFRLTSFNGKLYFLDYTFSSGWELWQSDGTMAGTRQVVLSGTPHWTSVAGLVEYNGSLYIVHSGGLSKLTSSNIQSVATLSVATDVAPVVFNGKIYFGGSNNSTPLYASDGTTGGTAPVSGAYWTSSTMAVSGTNLFRSGRHPTGTDTGSELWATDGTAGGLHELKDIRPGVSSSSPADIIDIGGGRVFFTADDGTHGRELWVSDGTTDGTALVKDIQPGSGASTPRDFLVVGANVYFSATTSAGGRELWVSDGTELGTHLVVETYPDAGSGSAVPLLNVGGEGFYFAAVNPVDGFTLYDIPAPGQTPVKIKDLSDGMLNLPSNMAGTADGTIYFEGGNAFESIGMELYKTDGSVSSLVKDIVAGSGNPNISQMKAIGNHVVFGATTTASGLEPWTSDGTAAGTTILKEINSGNASSQFTSSFLYNGLLYFNAFDGTSTKRWRTDGTPASTVSAGAGLGTLPAFMNGYFYFGSGNALARSDGTTSTIIKDFGTVYDSSHGQYYTVDNLTNINGTLYFSAADSTSTGAELWKSDGTAAGTVLVKDLWTTTNSSGYPINFFAAGNWVLFRSYGPSSNNPFDEWRTDGTTANTTKLSSIAGMPYIGTPSSGANVNGRFIFTNFDSAHGSEPWISDGTPGGTYCLADIMPGAGSSSPPRYLAVNGTVYFSADDGVHGRELWASDGTPAGTFRVTDINPGAGSADPLNFTDYNGILYFTANDGVSPKVFRYIPYLPNAGDDYWVAPGASVTLFASESKNLALPNAITYEWDFDNDGQFDDATGVTPTFAAGATPGVYPVAVRMRDANNLSVIDASANVTVGPPAGLTADPAGGFAVTGLSIGKTLILSGPTSHIATADLSLGMTSPLSIQVLGGATLTMQASQHVTTLDAHDGHLVLSPGGHKAIVATYITTTSAGTIDLGDGNLILRGGSPASVEPLIHDGRIISAHDGTLTGLGVATASQTFGIGPNETALFAGQTVSGRDLLVKYTYAGDANLDGKLNIDDYVKIDSGVASGSSGWANGDFNYDGKVNIDDYVIIDSTLPNQGPPMGNPALATWLIAPPAMWNSHAPLEEKPLVEQLLP
jgi:ELWxxDGT repeat protein